MSSSSRVKFSIVNVLEEEEVEISQIQGATDLNSCSKVLEFLLQRVMAITFDTNDTVQLERTSQISFDENNIWVPQSDDFYKFVIVDKSRERALEGEVKKALWYSLIYGADAVFHGWSTASLKMLKEALCSENCRLLLNDNFDY